VIALLHSMARQRGLCVVVVTHNPAVAEQADRVVKLNDGLIQSDERKDGGPPIETLVETLARWWKSWLS
jgi:putative ABC transport system ATP-binding protein